MSTTYRSDYRELGLDEGAGWAEARGAYRSLVNTWHPDRYARRPREREHAQQRFIRLTRSFDRLRAFYRENGRLPFEKVVPDAPERLAIERVARAYDERRRRTAPSVAVEADLDGEELLGRAPAPARSRSRRWPLIWLGVGLCAVTATLALFVVMDRSERRSAYQSGRDVLLETEPSEFLPSATEVRRQSTRGTFVTRQEDKMGDQLMEDIFRQP